MEKIKVKMILENDRDISMWQEGRLNPRISVHAYWTNL